MESTESIIKIDFQQYWLLLKRRWLPVAAVFGSVVTLTALNTLLQKPVYEAKGRLLIKTPNNVTSAMTQEGSGNPLGELGTIGVKSDPLKTEVEVLRSTPLIQKTIARLNLKDEKGNPVKPQALLAQLNVTNVPGTDILELTYESTSPEEVAVAVNQLMNLYLENNVFANRNEAASAREFIADQLPRTESNVRQAEVALRKFKEQNDVVALDKEAESAVEVIADLENKITNAQAELEDATARSESLRNKLNMNSQQAVAASSLSQSATVQKALEEIQQIDTQLATERARYQEEHPAIVQLKNRRASLETLLQKRVGQVLGTQERQPTQNLQIGELKQKLTADLVSSETGRLGLAKQVGTFSKVLQSYKQRMNVLPKLEQRQRELERELNAAQSTYNTLLKRLEEIRVEENRNVRNARIVEEAQIPEGPSGPSRTRDLAIGGILGLLLGIGTALILEAIDTSLKTVKEARELFGYTLLGTIPAWGKAKKNRLRDPDLEPSASKLVVKEAPRSAISEAYRMLQANLKFLSSDEPLKVIVVTSSVPQEGKSTVSANLAIAMAQSGRRVLLVDADLRRPLQHHIWDLLNEAGLSNLIVEQIAPKTVIKEVMHNLDVLTAGVIPPNPMALLDSKRMATLIEDFSASYDFVIIDTPSLTVAADAPILGKLVDGVLLVVRPEVVDSGSANAAKEFLEQSGQNILGLVINGVITQNEPYSYYYAREYYTEPDVIAREKVSVERGK
ncbi:MAG TPA: polysaccharide biosynthesis tyrosine autokinase [Candidatus Caenarcaniphilales bacterium]